jgi:hypothetical protein
MEIRRSARRRETFTFDVAVAVRAVGTARKRPDRSLSLLGVAAPQFAVLIG